MTNAICMLTRQFCHTRNHLLGDAHPFVIRRRHLDAVATEFFTASWRIQQVTDAIDDCFKRTVNDSVFFAGEEWDCAWKPRSDYRFATRKVLKQFRGKNVVRNAIQLK